MPCSVAATLGYKPAHSIVISCCMETNHKSPKVSHHEVIKDVVHDRWYEIEAAIVRIMKRCKSLCHLDLLDKLDAQLDSKFKVFLSICLSSLYDQCAVFCVSFNIFSLDKRFNELFYYHLITLQSAGQVKCSIE
jgi:hypothetical protein